ncbi:MAG TPA: SurA N-terminal domain-containing protein [Xanthobacteraceae bacterium]|nr:SurA N-terminal domain-containing protein [Xanthobacteraceae bacterium]
MLRGLHKASSHFLGRIVMAGVLGFLVISFGIWGIGDIFRGFGRSWLAKIGGTEIGVEQFRQAYNDRLQQLGRRLGRPITPDQAQALGLPRQMLSQMLADAALDERVRQLGLNLSDAEIARQITADPNFKGTTGQFDRFRFEQLIRNAGYTELRYAQEQRRGALRRQLAETVGGDLKVPKVAAELVNRFQNEQRSIDFVRLGPAQAGDIAVPSAQDLQTYFNDHKATFRAPEYRKVVLLTASAQDVASTIEVSDADARRYYSDHAEKFGQPERRQIAQIVFPTTADAQAAADRVAHGVSFDDIAAERGLKQSDFDLGLVSKSQLLDPAVADAAFSLPVGEVSAPIAGRFGAALIRVLKIETGSIKPFETVETEIKNEMALDRARPELMDLRDKIEDDRAAGSHLDEIAAKYKLTTRTIEVDRSGRDPSGKPIDNLPSGANVVGAAFSTDIDVDTDALALPTGGFVWYNVASITPSHERGLDEVKEDVEAQWRNDQVSQRLAAKATELVDKLKGGAAFPDVVNQAGLKVETLGGLKRGASSPPLSGDGVERVFQTPKGAAGSSVIKDPTDLVVFRVTDVKIPEFDPKSAEAEHDEASLRRSLSEDLFGQYVTRLESSLGISVNSDALRRLTSTSESD